MCRLLEADRSFVFFMETNSHGIVSMLIECEHDLASEVRRGDGQKNIAASNDVGRALDGVEGPTGENRDGRIGVLQVAETAGGGQRRTPLQWVYNGVESGAKEGATIRPRPAARGRKASSGAADRKHRKRRRGTQISKPQAPQTRSPGRSHRDGFDPTLTVHQIQSVPATTARAS